LPELFSEYDRIQGHRRATCRYHQGGVYQHGPGNRSVFWWGAWMVPVLRRMRQKAVARGAPSKTYADYLRLPRAGAVADGLATMGHRRALGAACERKFLSSSSRAARLSLTKSASFANFGVAFSEYIMSAELCANLAIRFRIVNYRLKAASRRSRKRRPSARRKPHVERRRAARRPKKSSR